MKIYFAAGVGQGKSFDEALEWARKCPVMMDCEVDLRPLFSPEMFDPQ